MNEVEQYVEPKLKVIKFTGAPITADSERCCYSRGTVGYE